MTHTMYDVPSDPTISKVIITKESVEQGAAPELVRDRERRDRPRLGGNTAKNSHGRLPMKDTAS